MTNTQFPVSDELRTAFSEVNTPNTFLHVEIEDEKIVLRKKSETHDSLKAVFADVRSIAQGTEGSYFLVYNPKTDGSAPWFLIMFSPDRAHVRNKMLYAATRETLKSQLGNMGKDYLCSEESQLEVTEYLGWQEGAGTQALTEVEVLEREDRHLARDTLADSRAKSRLAFPVDQEAVDALKEFASGGCSLVKLKLDVTEERVQFDGKQDIGVDQITSTFVDSGPRYTFFRFDHKNPTTGEPESKSLLILSCPVASKVKEKMLAATVKPSIAQLAEQQGIDIAKQLDVDTADEIQEMALLSSIHVDTQTEEVSVPAPARPKAGRGGRRMIGRGKPRKELDE